MKIHHLPLAVWLFPLPFALGMFVIEELRKWLVRWLGSRHEAAILGANPCA